MSIKITVPNTSTDYLTFGSANTPTAAQIAGIDSGSSNGQLAIYTTASGTSTERVRVDASGNVGIGTSSPSYKLDVSGAATATPVTNGIIRILTTGSNPPTGYGGGLVFSQVDSSAVNRDYASITGSRVNSSANNQVDMVFSTGDPGGGSIPITERMRLTTAGNLLVGTTSNANNALGRFYKTGNRPTIEAVQGDSGGYNFQSNAFNNGGTYYHFNFTESGTQRGSITSNGSSTSYITSSDYRLKENIQPMHNALSIVAQLNPVTYIWKSDGSDGQGFIAHELQAVVPDCVVGEKDAVDAEGNPVYQGIDTSFLVATLTAAIQELTARITALENK